MDIEKVALEGTERGMHSMVQGEGTGDDIEVPNLAVWVSVNSLNRDKEHERAAECGYERASGVFCVVAQDTPSGGVQQASANTGLNLALFLSQTFEAGGLIAIPEGETVSQGRSFGNADLQGNARRVGFNKGEGKW